MQQIWVFYKIPHFYVDMFKIDMFATMSFIRCTFYLKYVIFKALFTFIFLLAMKIKMYHSTPTKSCLYDFFFQNHAVSRNIRKILSNVFL